MKLKKIIIITIIALAVISMNSKVFAKYVFDYTKSVADLEIDRTPPILKVEYSNKELTNSDVEVKIIANEKIQPLEGWQLLDDGKTLIKVYDENLNEIVKIKDLSNNESEANIIISNIDKEPPKAELIEVKNTNTGYEKYANKECQVTLKIKISDNIKLINNLQDFKILVGTKENVCTKETKILEENEDYIIYEITLTNILENGLLTVEIPENSFEDAAGNKLEKTILDTEIQIDNIAPIVEYVQKVLDNGKALASIVSNEQIRNLDGWTLDESQKVISKEFISDINYHRTITDFAGNTVIADIKVTEATFLGLETKTHISIRGWEDATNNVIGRIGENNSKHKVEAILFRTSENVDRDFLKVSAYLYTYWGEDSYAKSMKYGVIYNYGYNPISGYKTMQNSELVIYENKEYMCLGGDGVNYYLNTDINGNNPIPGEISSQYKYGISGINFDSKDHSENSIIYQIYFDDTGWLKTCKNGEEAMRQKDRPIEALRIAVVPTSEMDIIIEEWDKDIGTYNY